MTAALDLFAGRLSKFLFLEDLPLGKAQRVVVEAEFATNISASRVVSWLNKTTVGLATTGLGDSQTIAGITLDAVDMGHTGQILVRGMLTDSNFSFTRGENLMLGANGALTNSWSQDWEAFTSIASAIDTDTIFVRVDNPIHLI